MTVEEAFTLGEAMLGEAREGKAYLRFEFDVVVGRKYQEVKMRI